MVRNKVVRWEVRDHTDRINEFRTRIQDIGQTIQIQTIDRTKIYGQMSPSLKVILVDSGQIDIISMWPMNHRL